jgi:hypothetical protein
VAKQNPAMTMNKGTQDFTPDSRDEAILINVNGVLTPRAEAMVSAFDSGFNVRGRQGRSHGFGIANNA